MKFDKPICPECGEVADGTVEMIPARSIVSRCDDGSFEYEGDTKCFWNGQYSVGPDGLNRIKDGEPITLECYQGHQWFSNVDFSEPARKGE